MSINSQNPDMNLAPFMYKSVMSLNFGERNAAYLLACQMLAKLTRDVVYRLDKMRGTGRFEEDLLLLPSILDFSAIDFLFPVNKFWRFSSKLYSPYRRGDLESCISCVEERNLHKYQGIGHTTSDKVYALFGGVSLEPELRERYVALRVRQLQNGLSREMAILGLLVGGLDESGRDGLPYKYVAQFASLLRLFVDAADNVHTFLQTGRWMHPNAAEYYNDLLTKT